MSTTLLQQALDALESPMIKTHTVLREAIRAHLAQPPATSADYAQGYAEGFKDACKPAQVEPVGYFYFDEDVRKQARDSKFMTTHIPLYFHPPAQPAPVPMALMDTLDDILSNATMSRTDGEIVDAARFALKAAWPAAPVPVPLTDEQIDSMWRQPMSADWEHREFARAIEAHHGIVASPEKMP
jgi:hypothetical protein